MEYKRFGDDIVLRLRRGEEILEQIENLAKKEKITLASVQGIGAIDEITLGWYDVEQQRYSSIMLHGQREVSSLSGTITIFQGAPYVHLHVTVTDRTYQALGGHLEEARVSATLEVMIRIIQGKVERFPDDETGLNLWRLSEAA